MLKDSQKELLLLQPPGGYELSRIFEKKGFTLAEVLVSLVILAVGILAIAGMQIISIKGTSFSRYLTRASVLAQDSLESLKSLAITDAKFTPGDHPEPDYHDPNMGMFKRRYRAVG